MESASLVTGKTDKMDTDHEASFAWTELARWQKKDLEIGLIVRFQTEYEREAVIIIRIGLQAESELNGYETGGTRGRGRGMEGSPPYANSWIRPWLMAHICVNKYIMYFLLLSYWYNGVFLESSNRSSTLTSTRVLV